MINTCTSNRNYFSTTFEFRPVFRLYHHLSSIESESLTFDACVAAYVALLVFILQVLASQLPFLANRNAELTVSPLFWPYNCIKIGEHVELLSLLLFIFYIVS